MAKVETEKRRLAVLTRLAASPRYTCGGDILLEDCRAQGIPTTQDQLIAAIDWLAEMELATSTGIERTRVASITIAGLEVANGDRRVEGVARPGPAT